MFTGMTKQQAAGDETMTDWTYGTEDVPTPDDIDPGIIDVVRALNKANIETADSGDGVSKIGAMDCAMEFEHVACAVGMGTSNVSTLLLAEKALGVVERARPGQTWQVEVTYSKNTSCDIGNFTRTILLSRIDDAIKEFCEPGSSA